MPYLSSHIMGFWNWINAHNGLIMFVGTMITGLARLSWKFKKWTDKVDEGYISISDRLDKIEHLIINVSKENNARN